MLKISLSLILSVFTFFSHGEPHSQLSFSEAQKRGVGLIDLRSSYMFNGWREPQSQNGGHFPGAKNFAASWFSTLSDQDLKSWLSKKKIERTKKWAVYGSQKDVATALSKFKEIGFQNIAVIKDWQKSSSQFVKLPNYQKLVPAQWLKDLISGELVEAAPKKNWRIFEVAWGSPGEYLNEHIPGAGYFDTDLIEVGPIWNKRSDVEIEKNLLKIGIKASTPVILYSRDTIGAARVALILLYAGVEDVRLLDGGMMAWKSIGGALASGKAPASKTEEQFGKTIPQNPDFIISIEKAKLYAKDFKNSALVSIRAWNEFIGETSGYADIEPKGEIPGAVWGHAGSDANHMEDFRNPDNTMISAVDIEQYWNSVGVNEIKNVSFYCGTGWRASETFFYAYVMGWKKISVFDGGWKEWSANPQNPIVINRTARRPL